MSKIYEYMKLVDKNLEFGQEFDVYGEDGFKHGASPFKFKINGLYDKINNKHYALIGRLLDDYTIKYHWKPKMNERYYIPGICELNKTTALVFENDGFDDRCIERKLECKTVQEAEELTDKILEFIKTIRG